VEGTIVVVVMYCMTPKRWPLAKNKKKKGETTTKQQQKGVDRRWSRRRKKKARATERAREGPIFFKQKSLHQNKKKENLGAK